MADDLLTVSDHVADALDLSDAQVSDLQQGAPLFARLPAIPSSNGSVHKYAKQTSAPSVGFRSQNSGRDFDHGVDTVVTVSLQILDWSFAVDVDAADAWRQGGAAALLEKQATEHIASAMFKAESQYFNGTVEGDSAGFTGLMDSSELNQLSDTMVVDAGGTTADTGSSAWLLRVGENDVASVYNSESVISMGETIVQDMTDSNGKHFPAYYTPGTTWLGLQIAAARSVARIANLTADNGCDFTDAKVADALEHFPSGRGPNLIVCSRRALRQLQNSRTATTTTGAPAPWPDNVFGIPLITSDGVGNTDALIT